MEKSDKGINITGIKKGYTFKLKTPVGIEEVIELFSAFVEGFDVSFTLEESKFKKFPSKFIIPESVKETSVCL